MSRKGNKFVMWYSSLKIAPFVFTYRCPAASRTSEQLSNTTRWVHGTWGNYSYQHSLISIFEYHASYSFFFCTDGKIFFFCHGLQKPNDLCEWKKNVAYLCSHVILIVNEIRSKSFASVYVENLHLHVYLHVSIKRLLISAACRWSVTYRR